MFGRKNKLKKYSTAQLIEELSSRVGVNTFECDSQYGLLAHTKGVRKSYPKNTMILFVSPQENHPE